MSSTIVMCIVPRHGRLSLCILSSFTIVSVSIRHLDIERHVKWSNLNLQLNELSIKLGEVQSNAGRNSFSLTISYFDFVCYGADNCGSYAVSSFFKTGSSAKNILVVSVSSSKTRTAKPFLSLSFTCLNFVSMEDSITP